tara:strand:+ start:202 stop:1128 length:927 start_codon:yes stop_codon:yes gene_type:complete
MNLLSIVIPVYFNEESLERLFYELIKLEEKLKQRKFSMELIFIDDGSKDNSLEKIIRFKEKRERTKIIKLTRNFGAVFALKEGLKHITGDCFTSLAADLQDPPQNIIKMIDKWMNGSKFVVCVRESREDNFLKKLFARLFYILIRKFIIPNYPKYGYDMALLDKSILIHLINSSKTMFYSIHLYWLGFKPDIIFYKRVKRKEGKSRWTLYKNFNTSLDVLLGTSPKFAQSLSILGIFISFCSLLYGLLIITSAFLGKIPVPGYATTIVILSFFFGLIIFYLSIIQEFLWRIFEEVNKRSEVIVEKIYD